jgi:lactate racemase
LETLVGREIVASHACYQHDCDVKCREVGRTSHGTPVAFNKRLWDYELLIVVSGVLHHYFAGFGGGHKMILPGVAARKTIQKSHELVFRSLSEGGGRREGVEPGRRIGNAVFEDFAEGAKLLDRPSFLIDSIRGQREESFAGFWAGDLFDAHAAACDAYLGWKMFPFEEPYDLVLSASGGHPLDTNLVQAHKGLVGAFRLVKPGGTIVHAAACEDGLGGPGIEPWTKMGCEEIERKLREEYFIYGQTMHAIKEKANASQIVFVSRLPDDAVRDLGMIPVKTLDAALIRVFSSLSGCRKAAVFPDAAGMLPVKQKG